MPNRKRAGRKNQRRKGRRNPRRVRAAKPSFGSLIAKGASALIGYVPGAAYLQPIADFVFRSVGWTPEKPPPRPSVTDDISWLGLSAQFKVCYVCIALTSNIGVGTNLESRFRKGYLTKFQDARLKSMSVTVIPDSISSQRQGMIALAFIPFLSEKDEGLYSAITPTYQDVVGVRGSKTGPVHKSLSISYRPESAWIRDYHPVNTHYGIVQCAFYDPVREQPQQAFSVADFAATIKISGQVEFRTPLITGGYKAYDATVMDFTAHGDRVDSPFGTYYRGKDCNTLDSSHAAESDLVRDFEMITRE